MMMEIVIIADARFISKPISVDDPCSARPCKNNAICFNVSTSLLTQNDRSYGCRCAIGFTGSQCEISKFNASWQ